MRSIFLAALLLLPSIQPGHTSPALSMELPDLVEKIMPSVVNISSTTVITYQADGMDTFRRFWGLPSERKHTSLGSGFIIDKDGFILTNNHVVDRATEVIVTLHNKTQARARIVGKDPKMDIALLQITEKDILKTLVPARLGDSAGTRIAETVIAIGNPFGLQHSVSTGIISAKNRTIGVGPFDDFLQTDTVINPGNSGGPLFNYKGEVIGINTLIFSRSGQSAGVGFAIPINEAKNILDELKKYGRVPRPWLGILAEPLNPQLAAYYELPRDQGVLIYRLVERGPADRAGLKRGDIVVQINGVETLSNNDVVRELAKLKPTESAKLRIDRGGKVISVSIKLQELPPRINPSLEGII